MITKILLFTAVLVVVIALLLTTDLCEPLIDFILASLSFTSSATSSNIRLFTKDELSKFTGKEESGVYLAILGDVFDVTKGKKHYGEGGGYHFFTGKDGTRAYVSGDFTEKGLIEDTEGLSHADYLGLEEWNEFYKRQYKHIGMLIGHYYNDKGQPTEALKQFNLKLQEAKRAKLSDEDDKKRFPTCNFEYKQGWGRRTWCSTMSGGVKRDWAGLPRRYFQPGKTEPRCACVKNTGPPSGSDSSADHNNKGDLDNPLMKTYDGCDENSFECFFKE
ncbi:neuferricin-like isoform X2 [Mercenaria mercenaria]|uniref:neuferricin-like isoform X2 n=1 Tax=Mercenaria mercenaria TaxID=6596 RepID=UPI00234E4136|nr:neuferricin-like isoform X2 [Mercenaria mercenaria]